MGLVKGYKTGIKCIKNAHKGLLEQSECNQFQYYLNAFKFLYQTYIRDLPYLGAQDFLYSLKKYIDRFSFNIKVKETKNTIKEKIVVLIPGFGSTTGTMPKLKKVLEEDYKCIPIDKRIFFHNKEKIEKRIIRQVISIIKENEEKSIVLVGYSLGGDIAKKIGNKYNTPSVTYATPIDSNECPLGVCSLSYKRKKTENSKIISKKTKDISIQIVEGFSFANPKNGNRKVIKGEFSHFGINNTNVINKILLSVDKQFESLEKTV